MAVGLSWLPSSGVDFQKIVWNFVEIGGASLSHDLRSDMQGFEIHTRALVHSLIWRTFSKLSMQMNAYQRCIPLSSLQNWHTICSNCTLGREFPATSVIQFQNDVLHFMGTAVPLSRLSSEVTYYLLKLDARALVSSLYWRTFSKHSI